MGDIRVEIGAMTVKAQGIDPAAAKTIMTSEVEKGFRKAPGLTIDPKAKTQKAYAFSATLTEITQKGGLTFTTVTALVIGLSDRGGAKAANLRASAGADGRSATETALAATMETLVEKAAPAIVAFAK